MASGAQQARSASGGTIDIGALESGAAAAPTRVNGSQPLIPPHAQTAVSPPQSSSQPPRPVRGEQAKPAWRQTPARRYRRSMVD
ncbi:MAG: hypothetical protein ABWY31_04950, partial [Pseudoxanthomonas sp.]